MAGQITSTDGSQQRTEPTQVQAGASGPSQPPPSSPSLKSEFLLPLCGHGACWSMITIPCSYIIIIAEFYCVGDGCCKKKKNSVLFKLRSENDFTH